MRYMMTKLFYVLLIAWGSLVISMPAQAARDCVLKSSQKVKYENSDEYVTLPRGTTILHGALNDRAFLNGVLTEIFHLSLTGGNCEFERVKNNYPLVLEKADAGRVYQELGIHNHGFFNPIKQPQNSRRCTNLPSDFLVGIDISNAEFDRYADMGYDLDTLCFILTNEDIRYDPETGQRVPTYMVASRRADGSVDGMGDFPFFAPPCFAKGRLIHSYEHNYTYIPSGCRYSYHPWSGRRLSSEESDAYAEVVTLSVFYGAGDPTSDARALANSEAHRMTSANLAAVKRAKSK